LTANEEGRRVSFIIRMEKSDVEGQFRGGVQMSDGRAVTLAAGVYQVRAWMTAEGRITRGKITRAHSSETVHFQTGDRIADFINAVIENKDALE